MEILVLYGRDRQHLANPRPVSDCCPGDQRKVKSELLVVLLCALLLFPVVVLVAQTGQSVYVHDDSDWWSRNRTIDSGSGIRPQKREPAATTLQILGVTLGRDQLDQIVAKLGKATVVERGDAATGRSQVCYRSAADSGRVRLIFESTEIVDCFYPFVDGPDWEGSDRCVQSTLISKRVSTGSGLRLGQTRSQVETILGKPNASRGGKLLYLFAFRKRTPDEELERLRKQHSTLSDKAFHESYDFHLVYVSIEARFIRSGLSYLAVSEAEPAD